MSDNQRIRALEAEVTFWRDQRNLAANVAATIADLDEEAPALRQLLRQERARRKAAEDEVVRLAYQLECAGFLDAPRELPRQRGAALARPPG